MELETFIAESAADAAAQVRAKLGPQAVVVQVRPLPENAAGRPGKKGRPRFEVLAYRPEPAPEVPVEPEPAPSLNVVAGDDLLVPPPEPDPGLVGRGSDAPRSAVGDLRRSEPLEPDPAAGSPDSWASAPEPVADSGLPPAPSSAGGASLEAAGLASNQEQASGASKVHGEPVPESVAMLGGPGSAWGLDGMSWESGPERAGREGTPRSGGGGWHMGGLLEASGFLPHEAQRVVDRLRRDHGDVPPGTLGEELALVKRVLRGMWRFASPAGPGDLHVLVGAPGVGKTTCLSKWLTQVALGQGHPVRVWRLDGETANTAEALAVYCDVLGVPLERRWNEGEAIGPDEVGFVDLPGTDWKDPGALTRLGSVLRGFRRARVHLVLNGAYDLTLMLLQIRKFGVLPIEDLVVTHLDEEGRWGRLWNLVLGTNFTLRHLSAGQNVPGDFREATPDALLARQFPT